MTTANVTMETGLGLRSRECAGVVFQPIATADFKQIVTETEELLAGTAEETGTKVESHDDEYGYRWLILRDSDFDDLVAAVFAYSEDGKPIYFIYNFKRGAYYPFVPAKGDKARNTERELRIKAQLGPELPWEEDMARWFPLWDIPL